MNIIEELKDILEQSPYISSVNIDFSENKIGNFGLYSTGESLIKTSVTGKKTFVNNFVLYFYSDSYDDINRINNSELIKNISNYLSEIWHKEVINTVDNTEMIVGEIENISCSNGMVFNVPNSVNDGYTYQIQIKLRYTIFKDAKTINAEPNTQPENNEPESEPENEQKEIPNITVSGYTVTGIDNSFSLYFMDDNNYTVEPEEATTLIIRRNNGSFYVNGSFIEHDGRNATVTMPIPVG